MDRNSWISRLRVIWFDSMCCESKHNEIQVTIDVPYFMYYSITSSHRMRRESAMPFAIVALHCLARKEKQKWKAHDFGSACVLCQSQVCVGVAGQSSFSQFLWLLVFFSLCASLGKVCFLHILFSLAKALYTKHAKRNHVVAFGRLWWRVFCLFSCYYLIAFRFALNGIDRMVNIQASRLV